MDRSTPIRLADNNGSSTSSATGTPSNIGDPVTLLLPTTRRHQKEQAAPVVATTVTTTIVTKPDKMPVAIVREEIHTTNATFARNHSVLVATAEMNDRPNVGGVPLPTDPSSTPKPDVTSVLNSSISAEAKEGLKKIVLADVKTTTKPPVAGKKVIQLVRSNDDPSLYPPGMVPIEGLPPTEAPLISVDLELPTEGTVAEMELQNVSTSTFKAEAFASTMSDVEEENPGFFGGIYRFFVGSSKRQRRNAPPLHNDDLQDAQVVDVPVSHRKLLDFNKNLPIKQNQTYFGVYRCEKVCYRI